jgi:hypothetical protein
LIDEGGFNGIKSRDCGKPGQLEMLAALILWRAVRLLTLALLVTSCERLAVPTCPRDARSVGAADRPTSLPERSAVAEYIPATFLRGRPDEIIALPGTASLYRARLSDEEASWYVGKLIDYGENSLSERALDPRVEAYRMVEIPSLAVVGDFSVRVEYRRSQAQVDAKRSSLCANGPGKGIAVAGKKHVLDDVAWRELSACMGRAFWNAPVADSIQSTDGSTTVFEGVRFGEYHMVYRSTLEDGEDADRRALVQCRALFVAAAGWSQEVVAPQ